MMSLTLFGGLGGCRLETLAREKRQAGEELQRAQVECREAHLKLSSAQERVADAVQAVSAAHRAADDRWALHAPLVAEDRCCQRQASQRSKPAAHFVALHLGKRF